jgi:hypothetical protein
MPELTLAEITQRTRDEQALNILNAAGDARYRRAFDAVAVLKSMGTIVTVWDAQDGIHVTARGAKVGPQGALVTLLERPNRLHREVEAGWLDDDRAVFLMEVVSASVQGGDVPEVVR